VAAAAKPAAPTPPTQTCGRVDPRPPVAGWLTWEGNWRAAAKQRGMETKGRQGATMDGFPASHVTLGKWCRVKTPGCIPSGNLT
jgi:hypothetical protein